MVLSAPVLAFLSRKNFKSGFHWYKSHILGLQLPSSWLDIFEYCVAMAYTTPPATYTQHGPWVLVICTEDIQYSALQSTLSVVHRVFPCMLMLFYTIAISLILYASCVSYVFTLE